MNKLLLPVLTVLLASLFVGVIVAIGLNPEHLSAAQVAARHKQQQEQRATERYDTWFNTRFNTAFNKRWNSNATFNKAFDARFNSQFNAHWAAQRQLHAEQASYRAYYHEQIRKAPLPAGITQISGTIFLAKPGYEANLRHVCDYTDDNGDQGQAQSSTVANNGDITVTCSINVDKYRDPYFDASKAPVP